MKIKTSSEMDEIPSKLLKETPDNVLIILAHVFNLSLSSDEFIEVFKTAKVLPLLKKGKPEEVTIYRPIRLLSCFSKILEKLMFIRVTNFLER